MKQFRKPFPNLRSSDPNGSETTTFIPPARRTKGPKKNKKTIFTCRIQDPDIPRARRDGAAHGGAAGRRGDGQDGTPTGRFSQEITDTLTPHTIEENPPGRALGSTNNGNMETLYKPMEEQNLQLTTGLSAVHNEFIRGTTAALHSRFPDMPCMKKVYKDKNATVHWSAARNEERVSSRGYAVYQPLVKRGSNADNFPQTLYMVFRLFVLLKGRSGQVCSMPWRVRGTGVSWADRSVGVPSCPARPRPAAPPCAAPSRRTRGMSGFWIRRIAGECAGACLSS